MGGLLEPEVLLLLVLLLLLLLVPLGTVQML